MTKYTSILPNLYRTKNKHDIHMRAKDAFTVSKRFFELIDDVITDEEEALKIKYSYLRALKDNDFDKFEKIFKKYTKEK